MQTADAIVIGAGANGTSTAYHLARSGMGNVVVVDRAYIGAGATGKSGALVRMHYTNEPETRLALESLKYFQNWPEMVGGECGFDPVGLLVFIPRAYHHHLEANVAMQRELGVDTYLITAEEANELDPSVTVDDVTHLAYEPGSGYADPNATAYGFARAAMDHGVEIKLDTPVTGILTDGDRVVGVDTPRGQIHSRVVVVAAGAWANQLLEPLGVDLGLVPSMARVAVFRWAFGRSPKHMTYIDRINQTWARPIDRDSTLMGAEFGVRPAGDPDEFEEVVTQDYINLCRQQLVGRFPVMRHSTMRGAWAGILMRSPDSRPIIGHIPTYEGLYCMAGDSGTSFKTSPAIGKCLSELITEGEATTVDLTPFRATRFDEGQPWKDQYDYGESEATISR